MDALTAVVMVISAFIVYGSLETAGSYSALLRVVDVSVDRAQEILDTPQMDISGEFITPVSREIRAEDSLPLTLDPKNLKRILFGKPTY